MKGARPAVLSTGTDEHGLKIQKAAAAQDCSPIELCNSVSHKFKVKSASVTHIFELYDLCVMVRRVGYMYTCIS